MKKGKNGYYNTKVKIGNDINGKPINKWIRSKTLKGIEQEKARIRAEYIEGYTASGDVLFGTYAAQWFEGHKKDIRTNSIKAYRTDMRYHILPYIGEMRLKAVHASDITMIMSKCPRTYTDQVRSILRMIFTSAVNDRLIEYNPVSNIKKTKKTPVMSSKPEKRGLTIAERQLLISTFDVDNDISMCLIIAYHFGLRAGEIMGLRWSDFDWENEVLHISRQYLDSDGLVAYPKTDAGIRDVPIPDKIREMLYPVWEKSAANSLKVKNVSKETDDFILRHRSVKRIYAYYYYHIGKLFEKLFPDTGMTLHWLRHNYICICWENKVDVYATAKFVGHSNVMVTLRIYNHLSERAEKSGHQIIKTMF